MDFVINWITNNLLHFLSWLWVWFMALFYWYVCLSGIVSISLFAVSQNEKYIKYVVVIFVIWVFLKGVDCAI
jgi:hypothetical protein